MTEKHWRTNFTYLYPINVRTVLPDGVRGVAKRLSSFDKIEKPQTVYTWVIFDKT